MRIGIISDIHANVVALEKTMQVMGTVDQLWCLGDVVGYGPNPNESVELLLSLPNLEVCLTGNHDYAVLGKLPLSDFNLDARTALVWTREQLKADNLKYLSERPETKNYSPEYTLTHASPRYPIWEYISSAAIARANFDHFQTPICFVGHTHVPVIYACDDQKVVREQLVYDGLKVHLNTGQRFIINPGSVGQPRDEDPRASYAILDTHAHQLEFHRVVYDIGKTQERMRCADLPLRLVMRLSYGW